MPIRQHLVIFFSCLCIGLKAQTNYTSNHEKISNTLTEYFAMNRENIHLHLNKSIYLSNEQIWFKGYIIEKKIKAPFYETTNVYVSLVDELGQKVQTILCYAENSIFQGNFELSKKLNSGKYFLQVYTNYMNNFGEDESSVYEITILNVDQDTYNFQPKADNESHKVSFFPESGNFISGNSNTFGVQALDCNKKGIEIKNGEILDQNNNLITFFTTNHQGYGRFEIKETEDIEYKAVYLIDEKKVEQKLPKADPIGICFTVDNYINPNKTTIKLKTNPKSLNFLKKEPYTIVVQQNQDAIFLDFNFKENEIEHTLSITNDQLFEGVNTVRLIDNNLSKIGERNIYKPSTNTAHLTININEKRTDSITFSGISKIPLANMSVSVLPGDSAKSYSEKSIYQSLKLDNYLSDYRAGFNIELQDLNRKKQYELDNYLLTQKSKYDWNAMFVSPPKEIFDFDKGLTVKGTINSELKDVESYKINMTALGLGINEFANLNNKKEFIFEHILALDSTKVYFVISNVKGEKSKVNTYCQVLNNNRKFTKSFSQYLNNCSKSTSINSEKIIFPKIDKAVVLDSIVIKAQKKLVHENKNRFARGYKISENDAVRYRDLLHFISNNGFTVSYNKGIVSINGYNFGYSGLEQSLSLRRASTAMLKGKEISGPSVYIDNMFIQDYNLLKDYGLETIDEIYISREHNNASYFNSKGIIKIYSKKTTEISNILKDKSPSILIKNGFQNLNKFENTKYDGVQNIGFKTYGTIDWQQNIFSDEQGNFRFSIPNFYQNKVKIIIEGITNEGQLISSTQLIDIPN